MLYYTNLENAQLHDFHLSNSNLTYGNFKNANLNGVILDGSDITEANLEGARFHRSSLRNATIRSGLSVTHMLKGAEFVEADLTGAKFLGIFDGIMTESYHPHLIVTSRLQRTVMPNGQLYNGCYNLEGDIYHAKALGYDPSNPIDMTNFYEISVTEYVDGQMWILQYQNYLQSRKNEAETLCREKGVDWYMMDPDERGKFLDTWYKEPTIPSAK
jgi:uncharacterized protein YjbI with pentapeptide repeats